MYNVKFIKFYEDGSYAQNSIHTPHYEVYKNGTSNNIQVTVYKDYCAVNGVTYWISGELDLGYEACYIENASGKTVEHLKLS